MRNQNSHKLPISKTALLWLVIFLSGLSSFSQTTNISGVVNVYQKVLEYFPAKACVRVSSTAGLTAGSKVLLIQMKGLIINTTNTSAFGDTTLQPDAGNAGNYEVNTICAIRSDSVFMAYDLLNSYSPAAGKVQLVQFGEYVSANVTDTLKATPWNNATGTGGVLAIFVEEDLTLNKPVSVNAKGFRGGAFVQSNTVCTNSINGYAYNASSSAPQNGSYKGEGIADVVIAQSGGRGAPANGGGGGNNHNNSGGGGANLNKGGLGGGNSSTAGCFATFRGEPGKALSNWGGKKIYLGGGGGAGHNNNGFIQLGGANGGGIIFIHANNIIGNGFTISANGGIGGNSQADGAGGGGAGGTLILDVNNYDNVTLSADGGAGGGSYDGGNIGKCYGGGGGGSGGAIYFKGANPLSFTVSTSATGGVLGLETGRDASCAAVQPAFPGEDGQVFTNYAFRASLTLANYCSTILPIRLTYFKATTAPNKVILKWYISNPESVAGFALQRLNANNEWISISVLHANDQQPAYSYTDITSLVGYLSYRVQIIEKNNAAIYSPIRSVYIESENDKLTVYPSPAHDRIFIKGNYSGNIELKLLDISGNPVLQKKSFMNNLTEISLPALPAGVYILHINNMLKKVVIQ